MNDPEIARLLEENKLRYLRFEQRGELVTRPLSQADLPPSLREPEPSISPRGEDNRVGFERHIILSDYHHRTYAHYDWITGNSQVRKAHDERAMRTVEVFMREWRPTHIHYNGDMVDFFAISKFCKSAPPEDELDESIQAVRAIFWRHRQQHPNAVMAYYLGNHDARWEAFIEQHASPMKKLKTLSYEAVFGARELRLQIHPYKRRVPVLPGVLEITHGDKVRGKSGLSAHAMLEKGISGVSGHTHRLGMVYRTNRAGTVVWCEGGCLCRLDPEYMEDPDWQQGFTVVYVDRENARFHIDQVPVISGRIVYAGQVYEAGE